MNSERITKTTLAQRIQAVLLVLGGQSVAAVAAATGVSVSLVYRWLRRYRAAGPDGLMRRSSAPHTCPTQLPAAQVAAIAQERGKGLSITAIMQQLGLIRSTIQRWLRRLGLPGRIRTPREPAAVFEVERPGDAVHLDIKKLRGFTHPGRKYRDGYSRRQRRAPRQYLHVCIDGFTRLLYAELLEHETGACCLGFLQRATAWLATQGIIANRIVTDNGAGYSSRLFAAGRAELGLRHTFTKPRCPQTNGKAERVIQTLMVEWGRKLWRSSVARNAALPAYVTHYNYERKHSRIGFRPPAALLAQL